MNKVYFLIVIAALFSINTFAQKVTTDKVSQIVSAENYFAALAKEKGIKKAFLSVVDENTIVFRPGPVNAQDFYKKQPESDEVLAWQPVFARIAKSADWGFSTGPYTYKSSDTSSTEHYGDYASIWEKNTRGVWKLALDIGVSHKKPDVKPKLSFANPFSDRFMHQYSNSRQKQREDIIMSSDKLFASILKADNTIAHKEFLADDIRLLFPENEPIIGKAAVTGFWERQNVKLTSEPLKANRSFSGELAFTYGEASTELKGQIKKYHYVRIWEVQPGFNWCVILEVYTPAG